MAVNVHSLLDELVVALAGVRMHKKYFSEGIETVPFLEHLRSVRLGFNGFSKEGKYFVQSKTLSGLLEGAFIVSKFDDTSAPTIIYHHGSGEKPLDFGPAAVNSYKRIFMEPDLGLKANLIAVCAPFHGSYSDYLDNIGRLDRLMDMVAVSVRLIENLVGYIKRSLGCEMVVVCGTSLGGFIANIHRAYFNSAEVYIPLLAGAAVDDVFINGEFRKITDERALSAKEYLKAMLNFEREFVRVRSKNVFPLLALYDRIVIFENQVGCYSGHSVEIIKKGHITGALSFDEIRGHIKGALEGFVR